VRGHQDQGAGDTAKPASEKWASALLEPSGSTCYVPCEHLRQWQCIMPIFLWPPATCHLPPATCHLSLAICGPNDPSTHPRTYPPARCVDPSALGFGLLPVDALTAATMRLSAGPLFLSCSRLRLLRFTALQHARPNAHAASSWAV